MNGSRQPTAGVSSVRLNRTPVWERAYTTSSGAFKRPELFFFVRSHHDASKPLGYADWDVLGFASFARI